VILLFFLFFVKHLISEKDVRSAGNLKAKTEISGKNRLLFYACEGYPRRYLQQNRRSPVQKRLSAKISRIALFSLLMFLFSATAVRAYNEVFPASRYYRYMQDIYENHNSHYCQKLRILAIASYFRDRNTDLAIKTAKTYATLVERHSRINNNLRVGTYILGSNLQKYDGNVDRTLDRYRGKSLLFCRKEVLAHYKK
jgi:hypothetical protein